MTGFIASAVGRGLQAPPPGVGSPLAATSSARSAQAPTLQLHTRILFGVLCFLGTIFSATAGESPRHETSLDAGWRTVVDDDNRARYDGFEQPGFDDSAWMRVDVPHNWDDYGGAHRLVHGNRHGYAWYRRSFEVPATERGRRVFLFFEGVGSYATVWVNGRLAGKHAGGRTTFTLDVTDLVKVGGTNLLAVRADHPAGITDLPWVCGGCSTAPGFSEGSQPMGIFRPVTLVTTEQTRVVPFGVHVWNDASVTANTARVHFTIEVSHHGKMRPLVVESRILNPLGEQVVAVSKGREFLPGESQVEGSVDLQDVALWSLESPTLYTLATTIRDGDRILDRVETSFGIRTIQWVNPDDPAGGPFRLNGKPVFINGTCEYEHVLGASHAFSDEQIRARVRQIEAAGFNAFRDAHQPHNLRYQEYWDRDGLLWWPQMAAQIWFDTPEFRANFKALLRDWVRERRNSPSIVLWGLANESKLPADFAAECVALIRELDPTSPAQRLVTTCNAGKGTDWNVPQNWTGTYGGKPEEYAEDLKRQKLVGEYGAWRSLGLHTEGGYIRDNPLSEDRMAALMEQKILLAESVRGEVAGHFHWPFATHDNPGRTINAKQQQQGSDGWAELDRVGPANNKGLLTLWGEPTDAFYLYRANYVSGAKDPMVYIVSHTWPDRWNGPGKRSGIIVYSNCDEVELFNDVKDHSLGVRKRGAVGTHFSWDDVEIATNVLYAEGRVNGQVVATDAIVLRNLPGAARLGELGGLKVNLTAATTGQNYLYRVNCGGPDYTDTNGQLWTADDGSRTNASWRSVSWAGEYPDVPAHFGSQRVSSEIIRGTNDAGLFQAYRYGREKLRYEFAVPAGEYRVELYFSEPWYGAGGGDCTGWRLFDVAVNGETVLRDVDLWKEAGFSRATKKVVTARAKDGRLTISFPRVTSYQAVISAIAISTADMKATILAEAVSPIGSSGGSSHPKQGGGEQPPLPGEMAYPVAQAKQDGGSFVWSIQVGLGGAHDFTIRYANPGPLPVPVELEVHAADGTLMGSRKLELALTAGNTVTLDDVGMNAGDYTVTLVTLGGSPKIISLLVK